MVPDCRPRESIEEVLGGKNSDETRRIQQMLNKKFNANLDVDGVMGPLTMKSIRKFLPSADLQPAPDASRTTAVQGLEPKKSVQDSDTDYIEEKWSEKYKRSINCSNPRGFSQRAHCAGRQKHNESRLEESSGYSLAGSFTRDLITSKVWLMQELARIAPQVGTVYNLGSWYGNLALYLRLMPLLRTGRIINVDRNQEWLQQGARMLAHIGAHDVENMLGDARDLDYRQLGRDGVVVNTAINDMSGREWFKNIPSGTLVVLQTRDRNPDSKPYESLEDLHRAFPLQQELYHGTLRLKDPQTAYHRHMIIGRK